jgi:hypothetical protein
MEGGLCGQGKVVWWERLADWLFCPAGFGVMLWAM